METRQLSARMTAAWPWISTVARLGLAAVFLTAGLLKVDDLAASGRAVNAYRLFSYDTAKVIGAVQPFLEIALGILLLIGLAVRLSEERRTAFVLTQVLGLSYAEAAAVEEVPVGTIRSRVARARDELVSAVAKARAV